VPADCYDVDDVEIIGIAEDEKSHAYLLYKPLTESSYYSPGIAAEQKGDTLEVRVRRERYSVSQEKSLAPGEIPSTYLHAFVDQTGLDPDSLPFGLRRISPVLLAPVSVVPHAIVLKDRRKHRAVSPLAREALVTP
jgi:hypothetical protein